MLFVKSTSNVITSDILCWPFTLWKNEMKATDFLQYKYRMSPARTLCTFYSDHLAWLWRMLTFLGEECLPTELEQDFHCISYKSCHNKLEQKGFKQRSVFPHIPEWQNIIRRHALFLKSLRQAQFHAVFKLLVLTWARFCP